jgi:hypothetical protein
MELTPEEKNRIYEEEKARHEAAEKVKLEVKQKKSSQKGLGCLIIIGFIIIVSAISNSGEKSKNTSTDSSGPSDNKEIVEVAKEAPKLEPALIDLSGAGQQASQKFNLEEGLTIFKMTHVGSANFAITLMNSDGERIQLLVNEIGSFNGSKAVSIPKNGEYILDVSASGKWTVKIEQPRPQAADKSPQTFTGTGQGVSPFVTLDKGLIKFSLKHKGKSNFAVVLMDKDGNREELLVNEIGDFDGSKAVSVSSSEIYLMDISADGPWTISAE